MVYSTALILVSSLTVANAANDWTKLCFDGTCEWSIPNTQGSASGFLKIVRQPSILMLLALECQLISCSCSGILRARSLILRPLQGGRSSIVLWT